MGHMMHAAYACLPGQSRGRLFAEEESTFRSPFQRDRDRIIHASAFRRLKHKTQVFIEHEGDYFRTRLTHSIEVAQVARTVAAALGLNVELTEAVALAHDLGHPPFGHTGEDALNALMAPYGGFDHNAQAIRIVTSLERHYAEWDGLNLTWEMLEGLAKHNGPVDKPTWALAAANDAMDLDLHSWPSLEAQIAAIADDIAYDNHDIDDGMRAGLLTLDQLLELPFIADRWRAIRDRFADVPQERLLPELIRDQIGLMVNDVLETTRARIARLGVQSPTDVRQAGQMIGGFSDSMAEKERALKGFMYENLYHHPKQMAAAEEGKMMVADLVRAYREQPDLMPDDWAEALPEEEPARIRHIADFLAGMTDRYARNRHQEIFGELDSRR